MEGKSASSAHSAEEGVTPIKDVQEDKWVTVKARVTKKSTLRPWSNEFRSGVRLFFELLDNTGEIRCISFDETARRMEKVLNVDETYTFTGVKAGKCKDQRSMEKFRLAIKHDCELYVQAGSIIKECDAEGIPNITYDFKNIAHLREMLEPNEVKVVDVIGMCVGNGGLTQVSQYNDWQEEWVLVDTLDLYLVDGTTGCDPSEGITLTLWGQQAVEFQLPEETPFVLAAKRARLSSRKGGVLNSGDTNMINPDLPETYKLKDWFDNA